MKIFAKRKLFPVSWANSVTNWILSLHSQTGTVKIKNTSDPKPGAGASIDLDLAKVAEALEPFLAVRFVRKGDQDALGEGLKWQGDKIAAGS